VKRVRKRLLVSLCFFTLPLGLALAQTTESSDGVFHQVYLGISGGYAANYLYTSTGYRALTHYETGHSFTVGLTARWAFFDWLSVQIEPSFIQKNYSQVRTGVFSEIYYTVTNSFVDVPLLVNLSWRVYKSLSVFASAGAYLGVWVHSHIEGVAMEFTDNTWDKKTMYYYSYDEDLPFDKRRDNQFDAGLLAGIGVKYDARSFCVYVECRFNYGLTDLQKDYMKNMVPRINDTLTIQAGIQFNASIFDAFKR
jgi:uncharacterized membrane protein YeaQ/YmgE (transglycosylase-associated protein family)